MHSRHLVSEGKAVETIDHSFSPKLHPRLTIFGGFCRRVCGAKLLHELLGEVFNLWNKKEREKRKMSHKRKKK